MFTKPVGYIMTQDDNDFPLRHVDVAKYTGTPEENEDLL